MKLSERLLCFFGRHKWEYGNPNRILLYGRRCYRCWRCELFTVTGALDVWWQPPDKIIRDKAKHIGDCVQAIADGGVTTGDVEREVVRVICEVSAMRP
jgi:hypothetical protein